jgi:hypothetical protein
MKLDSFLSDVGARLSKILSGVEGRAICSGTRERFDKPREKKLTFSATNGIARKQAPTSGVAQISEPLIP